MLSGIRTRWPRRGGLALLLALAGTLIVACGGGGLGVGSDAPAFTLPAADGGTVSLADYAGRPVLLYFHMAMG